jgi:hypothetical protein
MITNEEIARMNADMLERFGAEIASLASTMNWLNMARHALPMPTQVSDHFINVIGTCVQSYMREKGIDLNKFLDACKTLDRMNQVAMMINATPPNELLEHLPALSRETLTGQRDDD